MYLKRTNSEVKKAPIVDSALQEPSLDLNARMAVSPPWNVVVWDDPVNLAGYVVWVFRRVFGYSESSAQSLMQKIDRTGRSVVWSGDRERSEMYVQQMHRYQLRATLERAGKEEE